MLLGDVNALWRLFDDGVGDVPGEPRVAVVDDRLVDDGGVKLGAAVCHELAEVGAVLGGDDAGVAVGAGFDLAVPAGRISGKLDDLVAAYRLVEGGGHLVTRDRPVGAQVIEGALQAPTTNTCGRSSRVQPTMADDLRAVPHVSIGGAGGPGAFAEPRAGGAD